MTCGPAVAAGIAACLLAVTGCAGEAVDPPTAGSPGTTAAAPAVTRAPSTAAPSPITPRSAAPTALDLAAVGIRARIVPVTAVDRVLRPPAQPWIVGWWRDGAGPGSEHGTTVLTAHLDSARYGAGPFWRLSSLRAGDPLTVTDTRGRDHRYVVRSVRLYRKAALPYASLFAQDGPDRVVLVTCGGSYRRGSGWDSNVVATFVPA